MIANAMKHNVAFHVNSLNSSTSNSTILLFVGELRVAIMIIIAVANLASSFETTACRLDVCYHDYCGCNNHDGMIAYMMFATR